MCTGRVDLAFILRAFARGADGVFIGGCWPGECHYITEGNYDALSNVHLCRKLMAHIGMAPERLRIEWIAASEGSRFAEVMDDFVRTLRALGPLAQDGAGAGGRGAAEQGAQAGGEAEGGGAPAGGEEAERPGVVQRLAAAERLIPYIKLVERERLRVPVKSEEAYNAFYASAEAERLFAELIAEKLTVSEILLLLERRPLSTAEIAARLELNPSEVSRHMNSSSRQGLVRYDLDQGRYALA